MDEKEISIPKSSEEPLVVKPKEVNFFKIGFFVLVFFIAISLGVIIFANFQGKPNGSSLLGIFKPQSEKINILGVQPEINNVNTKDPHLSSYGVYFIYKVKIIGTKDTPEGVAISTDITDKKSPNFLITSDTEIFYLANGLLIRTNKDSVKSGVDATITESYNITKNKWITTKIFLTMKSFPKNQSATKSATIKK